MRLKSGYFFISCLFLVCSVESRPQFFFDAINKIKEKGAEVGCKIHQLGSKPFPHTHNVGTDPCSALPEKSVGDVNQFSNNEQPKPTSGFTNNQNFNGQGQFNQPNGQNYPNGQSGYGNAGQNYPNGQSNYGNSGYSGTSNVQTGSSANQAGQDPNRGFQHSNKGYNGIQSSTPSTNAIVFPGPAEKPKPSVYNSQQGPGGRTLVGKPNQPSNGQQPDARENVGNVKPTYNSYTPISSTTSTTFTTTPRSERIKSLKNHSSRRKNYSDDYSDEDADSDERAKKKKKFLDATPPPESEEKEGVTDGRNLIGKIKTNCPEGYKADRRGICREVY